jgi:precorrin-4 methylase
VQLAALPCDCPPRVVRKSSFSGGDCRVEVARLDDGAIAVRHSRSAATGRVLVSTVQEAPGASSSDRYAPWRNRDSSTYRFTSRAHYVSRVSYEEVLPA